MPKVDFDFQRYVERRKGAREAQSREGAAYAYAGDLKVLRTLDRLRPVRLAVEATERMWRSSEREWLAAAVRVGPTQLPKIFELAGRCAELLHIARPAVYVGSNLGPLGAYTFGTSEDARIVLDQTVLDHLSGPELLDVMGRECGHIQNNHVLYGTALHDLEHYANRFVRWVVAPAMIALRGWARRADVTADRAGLLCARDLAVCETVLGKRFPDQPKRVDALRVFAESMYYRGMVGQEGGLNTAECDAKVASIL